MAKYIVGNDRTGTMLESIRIENADGHVRIHQSWTTSISDAIHFDSEAQASKAACFLLDVVDPDLEGSIYYQNCNQIKEEAK